MRFGERLKTLRNSMNMSDVDLAYNIGVSRNRIQEIESDIVAPDLNELHKIAEVFKIGVDQLIGTTQSGGYSGFGVYEYKSETEIFGLPLIHIKSSRNSNKVAVAKGIIAIGDVAIGAVAIGGVSIGAVSLGGFSIGALLSLGGMSLGGIALGGMAVGYMAFGGLAVGINAIGGAAIARDIAMGGYAKGIVAVGDASEGRAAFSMYHVTKESFRMAVNEYLPNAWNWVVRVFEGFLGW